jgi:hypothetical protein
MKELKKKVTLKVKSCVTCMERLVIALIEHLQIVIASNHSAIANSHTQQLTTARTESSQSLVLTSASLSVLHVLTVLQLMVKAKVKLILRQTVCQTVLISATDPEHATSSSPFFNYF